MSKRVSALAAAKTVQAWMELEGSDTESEDGSVFSEVSDDEKSAPTEEIADPDSNANSSSESAADSDIDFEDVEQPSCQQDPTATYTARSGVTWSAAPPPPSRVRACNIRKSKEGPTGKAKLIEDEVDAFLCFFDETMLQSIVRYTNNYARSYMIKKGKKADDWSPIDEIELKGIIGVLFLLGVYRSQHESLRSLWSPSTGRSIFMASFSRNRFEQVLAFLRFDNRADRLVRQKADKFAAFRDLWTKFISNCRNNYCVGDCVTIDEQLIPFRGRVSFRQYLPSKPDKYGMKLFLLVDCESAYTFNGVPYIGKENGQIRVGLAAHVVKTLCEPLHNSGVNVTTDNWFTSTQLAADLLLKNITLVGTVRKNKPDIPQEFAADKKRVIGSSLFGFSNRQTMVSYVPKKSKAVVLLSTMHSDNDIDPETGKPEIILYYNKTKAGVDRVDQLCHNYSVQRRTKRWPLAYFYNTLNLSGVNSQVIYEAKFPEWEAGKKHRRRLYIENLGMKLLQPWMDRRSKIVQLPKCTKLALQSCGFIKRPQPTTGEAAGERKRKRCHICPTSLDRKTADRCNNCGEPCCTDHKTVNVVCSYCNE